MSGVKGRSGPPGNQHHLTHGLFVRAPNGVRLRSRPVQRLVRRMEVLLPWLTKSDLPAVRSWATLEFLGAKVFADLNTKGFTLANGEPRALLREYRQLKLAQLAYERELGLTPAARLALGLTVKHAGHVDIAVELAELRLEEERKRTVEARALAPASEGEDT